MRVIVTVAAVAGPFLVVFLLVFATMTDVDSVAWRTKIHPALVTRDYYLIFSHITHYLVFVGIVAALWTGATYLPLIWHRRGIWPRKDIENTLTSIPRGERLWFAGGCGAVVGKLLDHANIPGMEAVVLLMPCVSMLLAVGSFALFSVHKKSCTGTKWSNFLGWLIGGVWLIVLVPACLLILLRRFYP